MKMQRKTWRWVVLALLTVIGFLLVYSGQQVYAYAMVSSEVSADAAIVLGAAVWDGEPSPVFEARINHAINLYQQGRVKVLVFTGGKGLGDQMAESEVAKRYAMRHGVAEQRIYCETTSHITYKNLWGARMIMAREGLRHALLVSDPLHMRRAMRMAEDLGLEVYASPTPTTRYKTWRSKGRFLVRESRLYASYLMRRPFMRH
jgi:uncharacterized SAM-binding protein YcdF (DUF218 family)